MFDLRWIPGLCGRAALTAALVAFAGANQAAEPTPSSPATPRPIPLLEGLLIKGVSRGGRTPFHTDPIEAQIVSNLWTTPVRGDVVRMPGGTNAVWEAAKADAEGWFTVPGPRAGYVLLTHESPADSTLLLSAQGDTMVYVNGVPRTGDPYENGTAALPVQLRKGANEFLFNVGRGRVRATLLPLKAPIAIEQRDPTLPDLIQGTRNDTWGGVILVNGTPTAQTGLTLTPLGKGFATEPTPVPPIPPMSTRKVGFRIRHSGESPTNRVSLTLSLGRQGPRGREQLDAATFGLSLTRADSTHKETFQSGIDGSVQYYAVTPARPVDARHPARALVLSTHGASVEAISQARAYAPKPWAHLVAPTNRRPYGFDWEEWGRMDALEVLAIAERKFNTDPRLTYLTGHSMGGHGTWQLGATFPDRFAAIAPSAGWISFFSYAGGRKDEDTNEVRRLIQRAANPSDTLLLASNYLHHGVYILHGDADDNVPVTEARAMKEALGKFHTDFTYHEQPGAGHWWGNACVDWPPIFDLFAHHRIPEATDLRHLQFTTANPGISSRCHWLTIEAQDHPLERSSAAIDWDPNGRSFRGVTDNIRSLSIGLDAVAGGAPVSIELDGTKLPSLTPARGETRIHLTRASGTWVRGTPPGPAMKNPLRNGPFKEAFAHRMQFVYATHGTPEENAWAFHKARFDAETWWYRGNGSVDLVPDHAFDPTRDRDRGVVLYGNGDNNTAWAPLLQGSPVQVTRTRVKVGSIEKTGSDLACLFLRPRPGSDIACVAVISGTGPVGLRLTDRVPVFLAGVALPDCVVFGSDALSRGAAGARIAGFFGVDWTVENGEFASTPE